MRLPKAFTSTINEQESPAVTKDVPQAHSLFGSCCTTDLQDHPTSTISISSEKVYATSC